MGKKDNSSSSDSEKSSGEERNLFQHVSHGSVAFLLDTSGSMFAHFGFVKMHLLQLLRRKQREKSKFNFNVIEYSDTVSKWAKQTKACTKKSVKSMQKWLQTISCRTSTNTLDAIIEAFKDNDIDAVYIVTDGLPDQRTDFVLQRVKEDSKGRSVHVFYLKSSNEEDEKAFKFYENMARLTRGTCYSVALGSKGEVLSTDRIYPVARGYEHERSHGRTHEGEFRNGFRYHDDDDKPRRVTFEREVRESQRPEKYSYSETAGYNWTDEDRTYFEDDYERYDRPRDLHSSYPSDGNHGYPDGRHGNGSSLYRSVVATDPAGYRSGPGYPMIQQNFSLSKVSPMARNLLRDLKVLAKHPRDGLYYIGIVEEVDPVETAMIRFDSSLPLPGDSLLQRVHLDDVISYSDAMRHNICVGDYVLANVDGHGAFFPGIVLDGFDKREDTLDPFEHNLVSYLSINLTDDTVIQSEASEVVWIPMSFYHKIKNTSDRYRKKRLYKSISQQALLDRSHGNRSMNNMLTSKMKSLALNAQISPQDRRHHRSRSVPTRIRRSSSSSSSSDSDSYEVIPRQSSVRQKRSRKLKKLIQNQTEEERKKSKIGIDKEGAMVKWKNRYESQKGRLNYEQVAAMQARRRVHSSDPRYPAHQGNNYHGYTQDNENHNHDNARYRKDFSSQHNGFVGDGRKAKSVKHVRTIKNGRIVSKPSKKPILMTDNFIPSPPNDYNWTPESAARMARYQPTDIITNRPRPTRLEDSRENLSNEAKDMRRRNARKVVVEARENGFANNHKANERHLDWNEKRRRDAKERRIYEQSTQRGLIDEKQDRIVNHRRRIQENIADYERQREAINQNQKQERIKSMKIKKEMHIEYENKKSQKKNIEERVKEAVKQAIEEKNRDEYAEILEHEVGRQQNHLDRMRAADERRRQLEWNRTTNAFKDEQLKSYVRDNQRQNFRASLLP